METDNTIKMQTYAKNTELFTDWLLADKKSLYIENVDYDSNGDLLVEYCHEYLLNSADPDWHDVRIKRADFLQHIEDTGANTWSSHDIEWGELVEREGTVTPEQALADMDFTELNPLIASYIEKGGKVS